MKISSLNISEKKGVIKVPVEKIKLYEKGIEKDAHAGTWHRQVSILGSNSIKRFESVLERSIEAGEFAENITLDDFEIDMVAPLDKLVSGNIVLEVTQLGKKCHGTNCTIFQQSGDCVMPKEGIFCRVIAGGELSTGMELTLEKKVFKILVITLSDRCSSGEATDTSGPAVVRKLKDLMTSNNRKFETQLEVIPDEPALLSKKMQEAFEAQYDIIVTTGSTGIGPRDIAPETIKPLLHKELPGIMELIRYKYGSEKPGALLSRAIAGTHNKTLVFAIPGSPKAVHEYMEEINKIIFHSFNMLYSIDNH